MDSKCWGPDWFIPEYVSTNLCEKLKQSQEYDDGRQGTVKEDGLRAEQRASANLTGGRAMLTFISILPS